jgi:hypothetical protein
MEAALDETFLLFLMPIVAGLTKTVQVLFEFENMVLRCRFWSECIIEAKAITDHFESSRYFHVYITVNVSLRERLDEINLMRFVI